MVTEVTMSARLLQRFKFLVGAVFALVLASTVHGQEFYKGKTPFLLSAPLLVEGSTRTAG